MKNLERLIKILAEDLDANKMSKDESDKLLKELGNELSRRNYVRPAVVSEDIESKYNLKLEDLINIICFKLNALEDKNFYLQNKISSLEEKYQNDIEQIHRNSVSENNRLHERMMEVRASNFYDPETHHKKGLIESLFSTKLKK